MKHPIRVLLLILALVGLGTALATAGLAAGGTGPADALTPTGGSQTVGGNSQQWFRFDYSGDKSLITAWLDSARAGDLTFSIYTPDKIAAWINGDPLVSIGQGTNGGGHDLLWTGRFNFHGAFYLVVQNNSVDSISFRVNVTGDAVTTTRNVVPTATPFPNPFATPIPVGSVSGGQIIFQEANGGNIYTVNPDGTGLTRVTFGIDPALSPDKTRLAFARQGTPGGLFIANSDGSNEQLVYGANEVRSPMWSADGNRVIFTSITRIKSIAAAHELLSLEWVGAVEVTELARRVAESVRSAMTRPGQTIKLTVEGPPIYLPSKAATSFALVINELVSNAMEHGLAARDEGAIDIWLEQAAGALSV